MNKLTTKFQDHTFALVSWENHKKKVLLPKGWGAWNYSTKPNCLAIKTGKTNNLFVVDADSEKAITKIESFGVQPSVITPKGRHYYFNHQPQLETSSNKVEAIDLRGQGGLVFQGSYVKDGTPVEYKVLSEDQQEMPQNLLEYLVNLFGDKKPTTNASSDNKVALTTNQMQLVKNLVAKSTNAPVGFRSEVDFGVVCKLIELGLSKDEMRDLLKVGKFLECGDSYFERTYNKAVNRTQYIPNKTRTHSKSVEVLGDNSNSNYLEEYYGDDLVFDLQRRTFYRWNGRLWESTSTGKISEEARRVLDKEIKRQIAECPPAEIDANGKVQNGKINNLYSHLKYTTSTRGVENAVTFLKNAIEVDDSLFDNQPHLVMCENGVYDLVRCEFREPRKTDYITKSFAFSYDKNATAPHWEKFVKETFGDKELKSYMQKLLGYSLSGYTDVQKCFFWYGIGANGKSVLRELISNMWKDYCYIANNSLFTLNTAHGGATPEKANLKSKRIALSEELQDNQRLNEAEIKALTGGDTLTARHLYQDLIQFKPSHKLVMIGNHQPIIHGTDHGIWRRMALVHFSNVIAEDQQIEQSVLLSRFQEEKAGIFNWLLEGWNLYKQDGLKEPEIVKAKTREYRTSMDIVQQFIDDECEPAPQYEEHASVIYQAYRKWAQNQGETYILTQTKFGRNLADKGYHKGRESGTGKVVYIGLRFNGPRCL